MNANLDDSDTTVRSIVSAMARTKTSRSDVGVTTYIKSTLMRGHGFLRKTARGKGGVRPKASRGLCIGRAVDTQFSRYVTGELKLVPSSRSHTRLYHIVRALRSSGVTVFATQVPVSLMGITTRIDAVGMRGGDVVVVELKTTQHTRTQHAALYTQACGNSATLANGLPNTEETHHRLQCAFGVLGLRAALPPATHVRGVVVVSYDTDAIVHKTPDSHVSRKWFGVPHLGAAARVSAPGAPRAFSVGVWPSMDNARTRLAAKCTTADHVGGNCVRLDGDRLAVCVRERWGTVATAKKRHVAALLLKTAKRIFKLDGVLCSTHVLAPFRKSWRLVEHPPPCRP